MKFWLEILCVIVLDSYVDVYLMEKIKKKVEDDGIFCICVLFYGFFLVVCGSECDCGYVLFYII